LKNINKKLLGNISILYIEDEKMIRDEVAYLLEKYVKNFYIASNGIEGIELFHQYNPDIIITDIQMPKMNGLDMIEKIGTNTVPIIVTTAYSDIEYFLKAIELKVSRFVIKPIDMLELINSIQDCIASNHLRKELFEKDNLLEIVDENVLISITDNNGVIIDASKAFIDLVGYSKEELLGQTHNILKHEDTEQSFYSSMWSEIKNGKIFKCEIKNKKKNGEIYWAKLTITPVFKNDEIINYTAIRQDITNRKKLELLSIEDGLTSLYNRRYFNKIIDKEIRRAKRENSVLSLLSIDIDYFKNYNDYYGHPAGDKVLKDISKVLRNSTLRATDYAFRMGGEEFCILSSGSSIENSLKNANRLVKEVENLKIEHFKSKCSDYITISAGLTVQSYNYLEDEESFYKYSDDALYAAKNKGRNQVFLCKKSK
jgi:diguanylate cyclase (GGDEF)-like protein/PAS domain S-box-containing protein